MRVPIQSKYNVTKRTLLVIGLLLIPVVISALVYFKYFMKKTDFLQTTPENQLINNVENPSSTNKDVSADQTGVSNPSIHTSDESAGAAAFPTTKPNLFVTINSTRITNSHLAVAAVISPNTSGSCELILAKDGYNSVKKTTTLITENDITRCSDSTLDLITSPRGEWTLTVRVQVASNVSTATTAINIP